MNADLDIHKTGKDIKILALIPASLHWRAEGDWRREIQYLYDESQVPMLHQKDDEENYIYPILPLISMQTTA